MKKMIISRGKNKRFLYSYTVVHQTVLPSTYTPFTKVNTPILTVTSLQYFFGCFSLAFLKGHHPISSSEEKFIIFLHLDSMTQVVSVLSKRVVFSPKTLSQSCFRYSNHFFPSLPMPQPQQFFLLFVQLALYSELQPSLLDRLKTITPLLTTTASPGISVQAFLHQFGIYQKAKEKT